MGRCLIFATGTRADWGKQRVFVRAAEAAGIECSVLATGMHLVTRTGYTASEVEHDMPRPGAVWRHANGIELGDLSRACSSTQDAASNMIRSVQPDAVVVHGDRIESLAVATAAASARVPVVHVEGGERSGGIDDRLRYAVSALADLHLVANQEAADRLGWLRRGNIVVVGSPEADVIADRDAWPSLDEVARRYELRDLAKGTYGVCLLHAGADPIADLVAVATALAVDSRPWVFFAPNTDGEGGELAAAILESGHRLVASVRQGAFFRLLSGAAVVVGNSSALVRECPPIGVSSVVVGARQEGRVEGLPSVLRVGLDVPDVMAAIGRAWGAVHGPQWPFGPPGAGERFAQALRDWDWVVT